MALTKIGTDGVKDDAVTSDKVANAINSAIAANTAKDLTALSAANLTSGTIPDARFPATLPAASAANLTAVPAANITGTLPAISGANLTGISTTPADGSITRAKLSDNVKTSVAGRNMIINGACRISQRLGTSTAIISDTNSNSGNAFVAYPVDKFVCWAVGGGALTIQQSSDVPTGKGFSHSLMMTAYTTDTDALTQSGTYYILQQRIEGYNTSRLSMGGTGAKSSTLSFWVKAPTGTYGVHISNSAQNRVYLKEFTVSANQTWEYITLTFPGDTTGTWYTDTNSGVQINWTLAAGSNYQGTANQWATSWDSHTSNQFNFMGTVNNLFRLTGIQYEVGTESTEFEHKTITQDNVDCQRYFYKHKIVDSIGPYFMQYQSAHKFVHDWFPVEMRNNPSTSVTYSGGSGHTIYKVCPNHFKAYMASSYNDNGSYRISSASYSAEL